MLTLYSKCWTFQTTYSYKCYAYLKVSEFEISDKIALHAESEKDI